MILGIDTYNRQEAVAVAASGYSQFAAFSATTFAEYGFPTVARIESELLRYVDFFAGMDLPKRLEPGHYFSASGLRSDFTFVEVELLSKVSRGVLELTRRNMGRSLAPHFNHLGGMGHARIVHAVASAYELESSSIFEVGPGHGYAGVILGLLGHRYASYDITQGYYLWQNRLLSHFFDGNFLECGGDDGFDLQRLPKMVHMPWWVYMELFKDCPLRADIILSNSNLGEMNFWCLRYMLRISRIMLQDSPVGMFVYGNAGAAHHNSLEVIESEFETAGFKRVSDKHMNAFSLVDRVPSSDIVEKLQMEVPVIGDDGSGKTFAARDFVSFDEDDLHDEFDFFSFLADWPDLRAN